MKQLVLTSIVLILLFSCRKKTEYHLEIFIKNESSDTLLVHLYPKAEYLHEHWYIYSDIGTNNYTDPEFDIKLNNDKSLFISGILDQDHHDLINKVFDSMLIYSLQDGKFHIKFTLDTVIGYAENIFDKNSGRNYEKRNSVERTNLSSLPIESHRYSFVISDENIMY